MCQKLSNQYIDWQDITKKEARGVDDNVDLGEVQDFGQSYVHTQRGLGNQTQFYIPKYLVRGYDGSTLWFNVTESQLNEFARDSPPQDTDYRNRYSSRSTESDVERRIPIMQERLNVQKRPVREEAVITKEPVREQKTVDIPVTREELTIERRPASESTQATRGPVDSPTEERIPLEREEVSVSKTPEVKEEIVARKTPVTETRRVTEEIRGERVSTTGQNISTKSKSSLEEDEE